MGNKIERRIDLSGLSWWTRSGKRVINWGNSIGSKVNFKYNDIKGVIEITDYSNEKLSVKYMDSIYTIGTSDFKRCAIGGIIGYITSDFRYEIDQVVKDDERDMIITNREYRSKEQKPDKKGRIYNSNEKWYKYTCNKCGWTEGWIDEYGLRDGVRCSCCCKFKKTVVAEINSIWATDYWMVELGLDEEWAKTHTYSCNEYAPCKCNDCGRYTKKNASKIYRDKSIGCTCGDGFSYPEKFIANVLTQLGVKFKTQYSPDYLVKEENSKKSRKYSDFYLPECNLIIETDGGINHKKGKVHGKSNKTLEEHIEIDNWKDEQHRLHGIETIRINCFESDMEYIKNNLLNSKLKELIDLSKVDFMQSDLYAIKSNKVKEICDYWNNRSDNDTVLSISQRIDESHGTITNYLKKGTRLGWCDYNPKEEMRKCGKRNSSLLSRPIEVFEKGRSIGIFISASHFERVSEEILGMKVNQSSISDKLNPKSSSYNKPYKKIYTFKYTTKEEYEEYKNSQELSKVV